MFHRLGWLVLYILAGLLLSCLRFLEVAAKPVGGSPGPPALLGSSRASPQPVSTQPYGG